jgi:hypothetical protein
MSEITIVLYAPPDAFLDAIRDKDYFVTTSFGNSIEQRDAAHRREITLRDELEVLEIRHRKTLAREEALENEIDALRNHGFFDQSSEPNSTQDVAQ